MTEHMWFRILIAAIQPCCLFVLMTTLPPLFFAAGMAEGQVAMSAIVKNTFARYYAFQVPTNTTTGRQAGRHRDANHQSLGRASWCCFSLPMMMIRW